MTDARQAASSVRTGRVTPALRGQAPVDSRTAKGEWHVRADQGRPRRHGGRRLRRRRPRRGRADRPDRRVARRRRRHRDRRERQVRAARARSTRTPTSTCRSAARPRSTTSSRARRPRRVRRHDLPRRLLHPGAGPRRFADALADWKCEGGRQAADRHGLPHRRHRPEGRRLARGARDAAGPGDHLVQALHGLQGRADGRRRDALQDDGGRRRDRRARDGARRERRRDRRARQARRSRRGNTEPHYHALTRPPETEGEATNRAIQLARVAGARSTSSTSRARRPSSRSRSPARRAGTSGARPARSTSSSTTRTSSSPTSRAPSTSTRRRRATRRTRTCSGTRSAPTSSSAISTDHCAFIWDGQKTLGQRRLLEDPERRPGAREPAAHDPPLRRPRGPDRAEPDGRAALRRTRRSCSASTRARARSPSARTPTS